MCPLAQISSRSFADSHSYPFYLDAYRIQIAVTIPSPLPFACLSAGVVAIWALFGVSSVLDTVKAQSFDFSSGIFCSLLSELLDVDYGTVAVFTVGTSGDLSIPVLLELRQSGGDSNKACLAKLLGDWPKTRLAELCKVISNFGEMITSSIIIVSIVVFSGNTFMLKQTSHDGLEGPLKLKQSSVAINFNAV